MKCCLVTLISTNQFLNLMRSLQSCTTPGIYARWTFYYLEIEEQQKKECLLSLQCQEQQVKMYHGYQLAYFKVLSIYVMVCLNMVTNIPTLGKFHDAFFQFSFQLLLTQVVALCVTDFNVLSNNSLYCCCKDEDRPTPEERSAALSI